ncbi:mycofactocin-coupled SDR family oxidoreductase [Microbacterium sp. A94]|uniref:mycofactocin-coupled SDR family oxidoreductase n=1 Tax=Microbacterium sp. A94 TaxID=3450717 RepID=UPI003F4209FA
MLNGRVQGKVAFVTGAARGQGRAHALKLASEGADIIAIDICDQVATVPYPMPTEEDLRDLARQIELLGRRAVVVKADVRDAAQVARALDRGAAELGRVDIVSANAGILSVGSVTELSEDAWRDMIDISLTGVWHTVKAAVPHLIEAGGGSIILTSSMNGVEGAPMYSHYVAAKHGVVGLTRSLAMELAPQQIRVNALLPGGVATGMIKGFKGLRTPVVTYDASLTDEDLRAKPRLDPSDISDALLFLASRESRFVTGLLMNINGHGLIAAARAAAAV